MVNKNETQQIKQAFAAGYNYALLKQADFSAFQKNVGDAWKHNPIDVKRTAYSAGIPALLGLLLGGKNRLRTAFLMGLTGAYGANSGLFNRIGQSAYSDLLKPAYNSAAVWIKAKLNQNDSAGDAAAKG